jgi:uncharacterized protein
MLLKTGGRIMASKLAERYPGAALITGASAGLGVAFARHVAREGMDVVLVARRTALLETLADALREIHGVRAHVISQDLSKLNAADKLRDKVLEARLEIGMLINNAGFGSHGPFQENDADKEAQMVLLNCHAPVTLTAAFLPEMIRRGQGAIIMLASTAAYQPTPYMAVYGATKAFNLHLGEALWAELKPLGIDVLSLSPGFTRTEFQEVAGVLDEPPGFLWAQPEEVVATCFKKLGKQPSAVHGSLNYLAASSTRLATRKMVTGLAGEIMKPRRKR